MQKPWKMIETLAYGYLSKSTQWELSNEYQHDRVFQISFIYPVIKTNFLLLLAHWASEFLNLLVQVRRSLLQMAGM